MNRVGFVFSTMALLFITSVAAAAPTNFEIQLDPVTGNVILTWSGGNADVHYLDLNYDCTFSSETVVSDVSSPWTDATAPSVVRRFYRVSGLGSSLTSRTTLGKISQEIQTGYNILSIPFDLGGIPWAHDLVTEIQDQGGSVMELSKWDEDSSSWLVHDPAWPLVDFEIHPGEGFFVKADANSVWTFVGEMIRSNRFEIPMVYGYTQIGIPSGDYELAHEVADEILAQGGNISQISWWDASAGIWRTYEVDWPLDDFPLAMEKGYFVKLGGDFVWVMDPEDVCGLFGGPIFVLSAGGGFVEAGDYTMMTMFGQAGPAGRVTSGNYTLQSGGIYPLALVWP